MPDLRRKAVTHLASKSSTPKGSPRSSRPCSRRGTDEEYLSDDGSTISNESFDGFWDGADIKQSVGKDWEEELEEAFDGILERKGTSTTGREEALSQIVRLTTLRYTRSQIAGKESQLTSALLKSLRNGRTDRESILACKALSLLMITMSDYDQFYSSTSTPLKMAIENHNSVQVKCAAIHTLALSAFLFAPSTHETQAVLDFYIEIVENDGHSIGAGDIEGVVIAALEAFALLVTCLEDSEGTGQRAMPVLINQLESSDVGVRLISGECIALLYEQHYNAQSEGEDEGAPSSQGPYDNIVHLTGLLSRLSTSSTKRISKASRKAQHSTFRDVLLTVSSPKSSAPSETLVFHREMVVTIDTWSRFHVLQELRRILTQGLHVHFSRNATIREMLEYEGIVIEPDEDEMDEDFEQRKQEKKSIQAEMRRTRQTSVKSERKTKGLQRVWTQEEEV
ncbi:hypothetical protein NEOLI_003590 [Neolecta irregularis DAH-3]|uniref:Interferon-related developmental regulator N-terminal domain-containing protein n=1 Tax=Neolecta irregularis (strain DAH-3) TaxID=1198029 RepID=A0A1U7LQ32_NEOID|nr:hypothetical protein NEOLI_003590 [Neolecta irregularis DAH-3]|eukprot:OLL24739.1 hypothetical protein NEOLI_003590 [Neolecta irregularis DAH-3]